MGLIFLLVFVDDFSKFLLFISIGDEILPAVNHKWIFPIETMLQGGQLAKQLFDYDEAQTESVSS